MSATTAHPLPGRSAPAWGAGRVLALICGSLLALIALGLAIAGVLLVLAHGTARDSAGFYTSDTERFSTPTYALTSEGMQIGDVHGRRRRLGARRDRRDRAHPRLPARRCADLHRHRVRAGGRSLPHPGRAR